MSSCRVNDIGTIFTESPDVSVLFFYGCDLQLLMKPRMKYKHSCGGKGCIGAN